ncbi:universal stress protein [uncultured Roseobacter sp.]|uniref:universal stress protein n=1 Tax=uncultured Roseobacter sp. TaxID=114847 RepID=UPI00260E3A2A|nr:universal stress protein [uncultured Roseobacter sp.]
MKNIVIASDLSERSRPALRRAVDMAAETGAQLTVLHIVDAALPEPLSQPVEVGARTMLSGQVAEDAGKRPLSVEITVAKGDAIQQITETVARVEADLLIVGLHRRRAFLDQIRETTMEHLIRSSTVPVLLVTGSAEQAYTRVLAGVALSDVCAAALGHIAALAPGADLTVFTAHEVSFREEAERDYETWKAMHPLPQDLPYPVFIEARPEEALQDIMADQSFDLLVIGGHTRSGAGRYILGSLSATLIRKPPCDLLIAK